jgi:uncharacterized coiled-coil protein SlyX
MSDTSAPRDYIKVDTRLTLALLVTICLEAIAGLLWVGAAAQRLTALEASVSVQQPIMERMARIETQMSSVRATLDRIENRFEQEQGR